MTLANRLTLTRGALGLMTFTCLLLRTPSCYVAALILYIAATITDWIDGWIARRTDSVSPFGVTADPIADKVLVLGALIAFLRIHSLDIPYWVVFLIVVRELMMGGLRTIAGAQGKLLAAERWGKWKTGIQSLCIIMIIAYLVVRDTLLIEPPLWMNQIPHHMSLLMVFVTWASAFLYLFQNRTLLRRSWNMPV